MTHDLYMSLSDVVKAARAGHFGEDKVMVTVTAGEVIAERYVGKDEDGPIVHLWRGGRGLNELLELLQSLGVAATLGPEASS